MASVHSALRSGYGDTNLTSRLLANVANKSIRSSPHLANTGRRLSMAIVHSVVSVWPTLDRESAWMLCTPGRWTETNVIALLSQHLSSRMVICIKVCDLVPPPPRSWCTPPSLHCRTSIAPLRTSDEVGSLSQRRWRPASPERLCDTIFEMLTTAPCRAWT